MEEQPTEGVRVTDKRGQNKASVPESPFPTSDELNMSREELEAAMAAQAQAAEAEDAAQPAEPTFHCATMMMITLDRMGNARLWLDPQEIMAAQNNGIQMDRTATTNDLLNMSAQLQVITQGNELTARVVNALAQQAMAAQQQMQAMASPGIDPRIQRAARARR